MGVSEQIQEELRRGRTPEQILELLKSKGLTEANGRRFIERAQAQALSPGSPAPRPASRPASPPVPEGEEGDGSWNMIQGAFFFTLGTLGSAVTFVLARPGGRSLLLYGAILWGFVAFVVGLRRWSAVRGSRPFPALGVGISVAIPALLAAGLYINTSRTRTEQRQAAIQMVRDEEKRRGVVATESAPALDPVSKYIVILRNGGADPDSQREAAWRLGEMRQGAIDAVPALLNALKSPGTRVRASSAEALMKIDGQNPTVVSAVKELFNDPSAEVWGAVLAVFAKKGDPDANQALVTKTTSPDAASRSKACEMLGGLTANPAFAAPPIIALLKVETGNWVLRDCSHSLGNLGHGSPEAIAALEHVLASTSQQDVTRTATDALARLKRAGSR